MIIQFILNYSVNLTKLTIILFHVSNPYYQSYAENRYYIKLGSIASRFEDHTGGSLNEIILIFTDLTQLDSKGFSSAKCSKIVENYGKNINC